MPKVHFFTFSAIAALTLVACSGAVPVDIEDDEIKMGQESSDGPYLDDGFGNSSEAVELDVNAQSSAAASVSVAPPVPAASGVRTIRIDVTTSSFSPSTITAKKGENVKLELVGAEGIHGFAVPGLSINVRIEAGKTVVIDLPTDTAGTFDVFCSIPCGSGHTTMKATIVISE